MVDNDDYDKLNGESTGGYDCREEDCAMEAEPSQLFSQSEFKELLRDFSFSNDSSEHLTSILEEKELSPSSSSAYSKHLLGKVFRFHTFIFYKKFLYEI